MGQIIHFRCRGCELELETPPESAASFVCPECGRVSGLRLTASISAGQEVNLCAGCGHDHFYIQKDFSRALGMAIVVAGVGVAVVFFALDRPVEAMGALVGMALLDALIYFLAGSVTVCYACHTIYRGFPLNPEHGHFNLELLERHGGKDPRH